MVGRILDDAQGRSRLALCVLVDERTRDNLRSRAARKEDEEIWI